jgi:TonB family protein
MLTTLLESRSRRVRDNRGTAASVMLHAAIIFAAVYATATASVPKDNPFNPPALHYVTIPPTLAPTAPARADIASRTSFIVPTVRTPITVDVPTSIPSIDIPLSPVTTEISRNVNSSTSASAPIGDAGNTGRRAYDASEVESAVSVIGNTIPEYPTALRSSGIEGKVVAEFVVTENGRADVNSLRIISATNELFVESIRRALSRTRFRPATIGGQGVAQLVQQQFVFKLD